MDVILSMIFFTFLYQKYHNMRFLKKYQKKQKNLIEKVEVRGMLNLEGLLLKN